jgi:hypothetical protein
LKSFILQDRKSTYTIPSKWFNYYTTYCSEYASKQAKKYLQLKRQDCAIGLVNKIKHAAWDDCRHCSLCEFCEGRPTGNLCTTCEVRCISCFKSTLGFMCSECTDFEEEMEMPSSEILPYL